MITLTGIGKQRVENLMISEDNLDDVQQIKFNNNLNIFTVKRNNTALLTNFKVQRIKNSDLVSPISYLPKNILYQARMNSDSLEEEELSKKVKPEKKITLLTKINLNQKNQTSGMTMSNSVVNLKKIEFNQNQFNKFLQCTTNFTTNHPPIKTASKLNSQASIENINTEINMRSKVQIEDNI